MGIILNVPDLADIKAQWLPSQQITFVGFVIVAERQSFSLPEETKNNLRASEQNLIQAGPVSSRTLAQVAGKLLSAVPLEPLFARTAYKALTGESTWDEMETLPRQQCSGHGNIQRLSVNTSARHLVEETVSITDSRKRLRIWLWSIYSKWRTDQRSGDTLYSFSIEDKG